MLGKPWDKHKPKVCAGSRLETHASTAQRSNNKSSARSKHSACERRRAGTDRPQLPLTPQPPRGLSHSLYNYREVIQTWKGLSYYQAAIEKYFSFPISYPYTNPRAQQRMFRWNESKRRQPSSCNGAVEQTRSDEGSGKHAAAMFQPRI